MRTTRRRIASIIAALMLSVVPAIPASAAQVITYKGNTSGATPNRIRFNILKPGIRTSLMEGAIGFRNASGTAIGVTTRLIDDHTDSQVCTTGDLTWTAERTDTQPARLTASTTPHGTGSPTFACLVESPKS